MWVRPASYVKATLLAIWIPLLFALFHLGCDGDATAPTHDTGTQATAGDAAHAVPVHPCLHTELYCSQVCINPDDDPHNCGGCGVVCPELDGERLRCFQGRCLPRCPEGQVRCGELEVCVDLAQSRQHCGQCQAPCLDGELCSEGECVALCPPGQTECDSQCVDTTADHLHCGECHAPCAQGEVCSAGECSSVCGPGLSMCDDHCVSIVSNHLHCGDCNRPCPQSSYCHHGECTLWCPPDMAKCSGTCVDTDTSQAHCGRCDHRCLPGESCVNGQCHSPVVNVRLNRIAINTTPGSTTTLVATVEPPTATNKAIIWSSDNPDVARVDDQGNVRGVGPGETNIWVTTVDRGRRAHCPVTVSQPLTGISITPATLNLSAGNSENLLLTPAPATATANLLTDVVWTSSAPQVAVVDGAGTVRGISPGEAVITATAAGFAGSGNLTAQCQVSVSIVPVTGVTITPAVLNMIQNREAMLTAVVSPPNASNKRVQWISSNPRVATIGVDNGKGKVTSRTSGTAQIAVITEDGGFTAMSAVTVQVPVTMLTLNKSSLRMERHSTEQLVASIVPPEASNQSVSWSSSNPSVATVDVTGKVLATGVGIATIKVTSVEGGHEARCQVEVWEIPVEQVHVTPESVLMSEGTVQQLNVQFSPPNATDQRVRFESANPDVASVDSNGLITSHIIGETQVTVTANYDERVIVVPVSVRIPVTGVNVVPSTLSLPVGYTELLIAIVSPAEATYHMVDWTSGDPAAVSVDENGMVTAHQPEVQVVITATTFDGGYQSTCTVHTGKAVSGVSLEPTSLSLSVDNDYTLEPVIEPPDAVNKNVIWTSSSPSVATVNEQGVVTGVSLGSTVITVMTEDGGFTATCAVSVTVLYTFTGVATNLPVSQLAGWTLCHSDRYGNTGTSLSSILNKCNRRNLLLACRTAGSNTLTVAAHAPRSSVIFDVGTGNSTHRANGVEWYYSGVYSWGFCRQGDPVSRNSCDTNSTNPQDRLCWHTGSGNIEGGWRCGSTTGLNSDHNWDRLIYHAD